MVVAMHGRKSQQFAVLLALRCGYACENLIRIALSSVGLTWSVSLLEALPVLLPFDLG
jgi:hypothetical protein